MADGYTQVDVRVDRFDGRTERTKMMALVTVHQFGWSVAFPEPITVNDGDSFSISYGHTICTLEKR